MVFAFSHYGVKIQVKILDLIGLVTTDVMFVCCSFSYTLNFLEIYKLQFLGKEMKNSPLKLRKRK